MSDPSISDLLAALDIVAAERVEPGKFRAKGPLPDFFHRLFGQALSDDGAFLRFDEFPFVMGFLEEAERFWSHSEGGLVKSGPWIESDEQNNEYALEVSALSLNKRHYLIIELLGVGFEERRNRLQVAREMFLNERTARKRAEVEVQDSEEKYQTVFESAKDAILLMENDRFVDCNRKSELMLGCGKSTIIGRGLVHFSPERQPSGKRSEEEISVLIDAARKRERLLFEWQLKREDGSTFYADVSLSPLELSGAKLLVAFVRDITERKLAEEARRLLATAIEQAAETIIITDAQGTILYANPAFERTSGYSAQEVIGRNPDFTKSGNLNEAAYAEMQETLAQGDAWSGRLFHERKDGTQYEEDTTMSPVKDASGRVINYVSVQRDVTKEVRLEARLRQAEKMEAVGRLASGIAHDFNNVLNGIIGLTDLALDEATEGTDQYEYLQQAFQAGLRATDLVNQILAFSRKSPLEKQLVNLGQLVQEVIRLLKPSLTKDVSTRGDFQAGGHSVMADPTQIHQVLMNLCTNAYQAMQEGGGALEISVKSVELDADFLENDPEIHPGRYVQLSVKDTGQGIPERYIDRVFEPYFTTKKKGEGTGLGLAVVHGIVKSHGGTITVQSEEGVGTTFQLYLPAVDE